MSMSYIGFLASDDATPLSQKHVKDALAAPEFNEYRSALTISKPHHGYAQHTMDSYTSLSVEVDDEFLKALEHPIRELEHLARRLFLRLHAKGVDLTPEMSVVHTITFDGELFERQASVGFNSRAVSPRLTSRP
jgi:hypothetical protein